MRRSATSLLLVGSAALVLGCGGSGSKTVAPGSTATGTSTPSTTTTTGAAKSPSGHGATQTTPVTAPPADSKGAYGVPKFGAPQAGRFFSQAQAVTYVRRYLQGLKAQQGSSHRVLYRQGPCSGGPSYWHCSYTARQPSGLCHDAVSVGYTSGAFRNSFAVRCPTPKSPAPKH